MLQNAEIYLKMNCWRIPENAESDILSKADTKEIFKNITLMTKKNSLFL